MVVLRSINTIFKVTNSLLSRYFRDIIIIITIGYGVVNDYHPNN